MARDDGVLPGLALSALPGHVRSVRTPEFAGVTFHEVLAKSALNKVPEASRMPFRWTVNPMRGCSHACVYCLSGDTPVLMADGRSRPIADLRPGDVVVGTEVVGRYRRYVTTEVRDHWRTVKPAYRVTLADGTELVASGDHRFLTERGWKHVIGSGAGHDRRPHLTTNSSLLGFGRVTAPPRWDADYRRGYLTGMVRGDGTLRTYPNRTPGREGQDLYRFRVALADGEALTRTRLFLEQHGVAVREFDFSAATPSRRRMRALRSQRRADHERVSELVAWPAETTDSWSRGFLAGIFDAEGSSSGVIRISNTDDEIIRRTCTAVRRLGLRFRLEDRGRTNGLRVVRLLGGLTARMHFMLATDPAISRKRTVQGMAVKSDARLDVVAIEETGVTMPMYDITTGTGDFVANGVISHNCFARPTHEYLDLDAGRDFETQIVVKTNVAEVLRAEVGRASWAREHVALGTNTDPYQRAEGRYRLMPGIIEALAGSGTPMSVLTKGTLLRRDLPLLAEAATSVPVSTAVSLALVDEELQQLLEPGTPTPRARLELVRAAREAGLPCSVLVAPVLPWLTDGADQLEDLIGQVAAAGATGVSVIPLHLRGPVKPWFLQWLARHHPALVGRYRRLYGDGAYPPRRYGEWLRARVRPLLRRHGLGAGGDADDVVRPSGTGHRFADPGRQGSPVVPAGAEAAHALGSQPTLF